MSKILIIFSFFILGCSPKLLTTNPIADNNKDVLLLSTLIRNHLQRTNGREFNLAALNKIDSLKRISNNFERIDLKNKGSYISIYFKFSKVRDESKIELSNKEKQMLNRKNWTKKRINENYDGEIRFDYGERFYHIKSVLIKRK